jgi:hypothetical protein
MYARNYRALNYERMKEYQKSYTEQNKERIKEHIRKYVETHRDHLNEVCRKYQHKQYHTDDQFKKDKQTRNREAYHIPKRKHKMIQYCKEWQQKRKQDVLRTSIEKFELVDIKTFFCVENDLS